MHIEKNVRESIIGTLLDIPSKTKDGLNSRLDLVEIGIRQSLAPQKKGERLYLPPACFTLSKKEKQPVCKSLANMKVPDGYSSNIKNLVNETELKLMGLKSHDCHALMQHLLPIAIRSVLPKYVRECLTHVCIFFNRLCGKELELDKLDALHEHVAKTLCNLEKFFPPSFFDIMIHLMVHLVREARLCGPVWVRWMYLFERNMKVLKSYVRNHYQPEACMVECYISEEAVEFCSEYMAGVEAIGISKPRIDPDDVDRGLRGKGTMVTVSKLELDQAQLVVMNNNAEVQPYITNTIISKLNEPNHGVSDVLSRIALGPTFTVAKHEAYIVRGKRFHTKSRDDAREVQNSGIRIVAETMHFASAKDRNPVLGTMTYYGVIEEIWELNYFAFRIPLFKCSWVDNNVGVKTDELGFTLVDLKRRFLETEEDAENADLCYDDFIVGQPIHEQLMGIDRNIEEDDAEYIRNDINEGIWVNCDSDMVNSESGSDSGAENECPTTIPTRGPTQMNEISKLMV
ncbi:uncharacterized protein LOC133034322 [Cannabis sativa]|uniref:uncharacterized protein LOC133034322 n=1 Tax=Cannabis sativa TaxID=3483 RepID=UPI0029C9B397|nr:uncharacterized protein LOC133034322 [Cannabis sativa]